MEGLVRTGLSGHRRLDRGLYGLHLAAAFESPTEVGTFASMGGGQKMATGISGTTQCRVTIAG